MRSGGLNRLRNAIHRVTRPKHAYSGRHVLIACFPKSGSTFVSRNLADLFDYKFICLTGGERNREMPVSNEQNLVEERIREIGYQHTVTQAHCPASDCTLHLMAKYKFQVVVLVRNIFDVCMSLSDHYVRDIDPRQPIAVVDEGFAGMSEPDRLDFIIDMMMPWYFKFYVSWCMAEHQGYQTFLWATYEDMVHDPVGFFEELTTFVGVPCDRSAIEQKVDIKNQPPKRFNKGIVGRGHALSAAQRARIIHYASYYPSVNFHRIGL